MADQKKLIIIRLHPDKPIKADEFTNYLNGLIITAYDLSTADSKVGQVLGSAQYRRPPDPDQPWILDPDTRIVQHLTTSEGVNVHFPLGGDFHLQTPPVKEAVATAVIEFSAAALTSSPTRHAPSRRL